MTVPPFSKVTVLGTKVPPLTPCCRVTFVVFTVAGFNAWLKPMSITMFVGAPVEDTGFVLTITGAVFVGSAAVVKEP